MIIITKHGGLAMRRFHRISYPEIDRYRGFNPEKIESVQFEPHEDQGYRLIISMGSGNVYTLHEETRESALHVYSRLTGSPPASSSFDDITKSFFPTM